MTSGSTMRSIWIVVLSFITALRSEEASSPGVKKDNTEKGVLSELVSVCYSWVARKVLFALHSSSCTFFAHVLVPKGHAVEGRTVAHYPQKNRFLLFSCVCFYRKIRLKLQSKIWPNLYIDLTKMTFELLTSGFRSKVTGIQLVWKAYSLCRFEKKRLALVISGNKFVSFCTEID